MISINTTIEFGLDQFRELFRFHVGAVAIITSYDEKGEPTGFTATSVTSVSAVPPILSFSVTSQSSSLDALLAASHAAVHFLSPEHVELATRFATSGADKFGLSSWHDSSQRVPLLDEVQTRVIVSLDAKVEAGSSWIFIARILEGDIEEDREAVVYGNRKFFTAREID